jgi:acetate---CoA ligase (ADP-forming)
MKLATLENDTQQRLRAVLPDFATVNNPLDLTGAATTDFSIIENAIAVVGAAPEVGLLLYVFEVPTGTDDALAFAVPSLEAIGRAAQAIGKPLLLLSTNIKTMGPSSLRLTADNKLAYISGGMEIGLPAIARAVRWQKRRESLKSTQSITAKTAPPPKQANLPRSEHEAQNYLRQHGVPVVPSILCATAGEAMSAARNIGGRVVVKIASPDIAHKSDIGGVKVDVAAEDAGKAFDEIVASARKHLPQAQIDGVLVSPMRRGGIELLVGITRDPQWGLTLAVGLGGIFVEILKDVSLRPLPVSDHDVIEMLGELRGARMLAGYRNTPAADLGELARVITKISEAAAAAGPCLNTLEVNPLIADGKRIEALDALIVAADGGKT